MADFLSGPLGVPFHQILHQQRNIVLPLAQGWNTYGENVKPIKKILAECTRAYSGFQVAVRCSKHAHVDRNRLAAPDPLEFSFLEHSQQSNLHLGQEFADLVQENRSTIGGFEPTSASLNRPGKGTFLVAEELGSNQRRRNCRTID